MNRILLLRQKKDFGRKDLHIEKLYNYLHFVLPEKISFIPLDTYDYAMQVRIKK